MIDHLRSESSADPLPLRSDNPDSGAGEQQVQVREIIRSEVDRLGPLDDARRAIELIVESSVRPVVQDGRATIMVVDEQGRTRTIVENGREREFTVRDLLRELRVKHPRLFRSPDESVSEPSDEKIAGSRRAERPAEGTSIRPSAPQAAPDASSRSRATAKAKPARDWLNVASSAAEPRMALAAKLQMLERQPVLQTPAAPLQNAFPPRHRPAASAEPSQTHPPKGGLYGEPAEGEDDWTEDASRFSFRLVGSVAALVVVAIAGISAWMFTGSAPENVAAPDSVAVLPEPDPDPEPQSEPQDTSSVAPEGQALPSGPAAEPSPSEPLQGVPEVLDTATLFLDGRIVPLFGVEWARGAGSPEDLNRYLNGREVVCRPALSTDAYRCSVGEHDLSKVVLFNGGGRAKADATPELKAAEDAARSAKRGLWSGRSGTPQ